MISITFTFQKNDVIPDIFPGLFYVYIRIALFTEILLLNSKILPKTLINDRELNAYPFLGVPEVRAQFWEILGYSY